MDKSEAIDAFVESVDARYGRGRYDLCSDEERTVCLCWIAKQVVSNGGFEFFFERPLFGDETYVRTVRALEAIGAHRASEALKQVLLAFPNGRPPEESEDRRETFSRLSRSAVASLEQMFWQDEAAITEGLARLVARLTASAGSMAES